MSRWPSWLLAICLVGSALRLAGLGASAVWFDEAYTAGVARLPALEMVRVSAMNSWPPAWYLLTALFLKFGLSEFTLRLPALLCGIATLPLAWAVAERLGLSETARIVGVGALAVLPYQLWIAQDARAYSLLALLYLAAVWFGLERRWLGLAACVGLSLYTHFVTFYYLPALALALWLKIPVRNRKRLALALAGGALSFTPYAPAFLSQTLFAFWLKDTGPAYHLQAVTLNLFAGALPTFNLTVAAFALTGLSILLALGITVAACFDPMQKFRRRLCGAELCSGPGQVLWSGVSVELGILALGPLALMWAFTLLVRPMLYYRPLSALSLPLVLWLAGCFTSVKRGRLLLAGAWLPLVLVGLAAWSPAWKGAELRTYARLIADAWRPGDVLYHATATSLLPFRFYLPDKPTYLVDDPTFSSSLLSNREQAPFGIVAADLDRLPGWRRAWLVMALDDEANPETTARLAGYIGRYRGQRIGVIRYWQAAPIEVWLLEKP